MDLPIPNAADPSAKANFVELIKSINENASVDGFDLTAARCSADEMLLDMYGFTDEEVSLFS
jgi:hypothetical protein